VDAFSDEKKGVIECPDHHESESGVYHPALKNKMLEK
jgi:hypothetical protein